MYDKKRVIALICLLMFVSSYQSVEAQENLAQQAYAISGHLLRKSSLSIQHSLKQARLFRENR